MTARLPGAAFAAALALVLAYVAASGFGGRGLSGLFPAVVGTVGLIAALVNLVQVLRGTDAGAENQMPAGADARTMAVLSLGVPSLYAVLLWLLGFWAASAVVLLGLPRLLGYRNWKAVLAVGALTLLAVQVVFVGVFEMRLPQGLVMQSVLDALDPEGR